MNRIILNYAAVVLAVAAGLKAQNTQSAEVKTYYVTARNNILKAADQMPEADYDFKPTPQVRTFGQLIAHVADAQMGLCGIVKGEMKRGDAASKTSKADLVAALKASSDYCDSVYNGMTEAEGRTIVKSPRGEQSKSGLLVFNVAHDNEMYGTIAVYLRLKGLVPPSTAEGPSPGR